MAPENRLTNSRGSQMMKEKEVDERKGKCREKK